MDNHVISTHPCNSHFQQGRGYPMPRPVICGWRLVWVTGTPSPSRRSPAPCPPPLRARLLLCLEGERPRPRRRGFHPGSRTRSSRLQPPRFALFWRREKRWGKGIAPPPPLCGSVGTRVRVFPPPPAPRGCRGRGHPAQTAAGTTLTAPRGHAWGGPPPRTSRLARRQRPRPAPPGSPRRRRRHPQRRGRGARRGVGPPAPPRPAHFPAGGLCRAWEM